MADIEEQLKKADFRGIVISSIIAAFSIVAGLSWRDAIDGTIKLFIPKGEGLVFEYLSALIVTVFLLAVGYSLLKLQDVRIEKLARIARSIKRVERKDAPVKSAVRGVGMVERARKFKYKFRS